MTLLDWALVVVWAGVTLAGFWRGAVRLVLGIGGGVAGLWLAVVAGEDIAAQLDTIIGPGWLAAVLGRLLPLVLCTLLAWAAGWGFENTLQALHLGWLNRLLGATLAGVAAALLLAVLIVTASRFSPGAAAVCRDSRLTPWLVSGLDLVLGKAQQAELPVPNPEG